MTSVRRRVLSIACVGLGLLAAAGCKRERAHDGGAGSTTTRSAEGRLMAESATTRLADARCHRELDCAHVRAGQGPATLEGCRSRISSELSKSLNPEACPRGIDQAQLVQCVAALEHSSCVDPIGALIEYEDCKTSKLCLAGEGP